VEESKRGKRRKKRKEFGCKRMKQRLHREKKKIKETETGDKGS